VRGVIGRGVELPPMGEPLLRFARTKELKVIS